jgi:hypothetical protein
MFTPPYLIRSGAAALFSIYGVLVLVQAALGPDGPAEGTRGEVALATLHFVITLAVAEGLRRARRLSWWAALLLVAVWLFFLLPIVMGYFLGTREGPRPSASDSWFLLSSFAVLAVLAAILVAGRRTLGFADADRGAGRARGEGE